MSRKFIIFISLGLSMSLLGIILSQEKRPPNVIIILADDQGWGDLGTNGNTNLHTPNIDGIAADGATFSNFYVCAVCSPTRAEMLTGRYHFRGGVYSTSAGGERLDADELTLADVFKKVGYATAAYGKWHNGMQAPYHPNTRGFDDFYGFCSGHWGHYFSPMLEHNGRIVQGNGFLVDDLTDHGLAFMEEHKDQPFLLYLPFNTPHTPFQVPDRNWDAFREKDIVMRSEHDEDLQETRAALAMCENIDENVGRIIAKTETLGIDKNTIVLYFSDNGPNTWRWNGGMRGKKGSTDEGGVRSPLLVKWPGKIKAGIQVERLSSVTDLLPTLTDLCGVPLETPEPLDGISLAGTVLGKEKDWEDRYILNLWKNSLSIRSQQYRLDNRGRLYDIAVDRQQKTDLSEKKPEIRKQMVQVADEFRAQIAKELPVEDTRPFTLGHPGLKFTQIPARDGIAHGGIERSSSWPNCSFFTHWTRQDDSITWQVNVPEGGAFSVQLYYTCMLGDEGSLIRLSVGEHFLDARILQPFDPPLRGMEEDRAPRRGESYVKDWKVLDMGTMNLEAGEALMSLKALEIPGSSVIDFRLLLFERTR